MVCQPTTAKLIDCLDCTPSPPPTPLVWSRGNSITEQRLCWQRPRQHRAQGRPFTFRPLSTSPKTQEESKVAQMRVSVNAQRELKTGSERGKKEKKEEELRREKSGKGRIARVLTFVQRYRTEDIFQLESMLKKSGSSTIWPDELLSSLFRIYQKDRRNRDSWLTSFTLILALHSWLQKRGKEGELWVWYRNHCSVVHIKVWNGNRESGAVCFPLGGYVRLCLCYWPSFLFPSDCFIKRGGCDVTSADRHMLIASGMPYTTLACILNAFDFWIFHSVACFVYIWATGL